MRRQNGTVKKYDEATMIKWLASTHLAPCRDWSDWKVYVVERWVNQLVESREVDCRRLEAFLRNEVEETGVGAESDLCRCFNGGRERQE